MARATNRKPPTHGRRAQTPGELLGLVRRFGEDLSGSISAPAMIKKFIEVVGRIFPASPVFLGIHKGEALDLVAATGALSPLKGKRFSSSRIRRRVTRGSRENRLVTDWKAIAPYAPQSPGCKAVLVVPLWGLREELGLLWIELARPSVATGDRVELARLLGNQFGTAYRSLILKERTGYLHGYLESLIEHTNASILVLDSDRRVKVANAVMGDLVGLGKDELIGTDLLDFAVVDERYGRWKGVFEKALGGDPVTGEPIDIVSLTGGVRRLAVNAARIPGTEPGASPDVLIVGVDVTETAALKEGVAQAQKLASLGEMAAGIAHEFNSPLTVLESASELLLRGVERLGISTEDIKKPAGFLRESVGRVQSLARNLLSYARPAGRQEAAPLDLNAEIGKALSFSRYEMGRGNIKIVADLAGALPPVEGNPAEIQQVFLNLLNNARQAMTPGGGRIHVATGVGRDGWVEIRIRDQGRGIPEKIRGRIFEAFFTTKPEGSGLGLYIVRGIMDRHGAAIAVESGKDGTTFILRFPAKGPAASSSPTPPA